MPNGYEYQFDTREEFVTFEQSVTNQLEILRNHQAEGIDVQAPDARETLLTELLDRIQRKRHGSEGEPVSFRFASESELFLSALSLLMSARLIENTGVKDGFDEERVTRMTVALAVDLEELHPEDNVLDSVSIDFPYRGEN